MRSIGVTSNVTATICADTAVREGVVYHIANEPEARTSLRDCARRGS